MAVTNRAKKPERLPTWAQKGKLRLAHVFGGPLETARLILSGRWDHSLKELMGTARYSPALDERLGAHKFNAVCLTWSAGFSHAGEAVQRETIAALMPLLKKRKIRTIASISVAAANMEELVKVNPESNEWMLRGDNQLHISDEPGSRFVKMNLNHPGWREYIAQKAKSALDAGFDGIFIDDSLAGETAGMAGLLRELRENLRTHRGPDAEEILFYCNSFGVPVLSLIGNMHCCTAFWLPGFHDTLPGGFDSGLVFLKQVFEAGGRDKPFCNGFVGLSGEALVDKPPVAHVTSSVPSEIPDSKLSALYAAECLASGGLCVELDAPENIQRFQAERTALFGVMDPVNSIAVLADDCSEFVSAGTLPLMLLRRNIQFDLIPMTCIEHFDLKKYKLVSAIGLQTIPAATAEALGAFVRRGGTALVSSGLAGVDFSALKTPVEARLESAEGDGKVIVYPAAETTSDAVLNDFKLLGGEMPMEVNGPDGVIALLWGKGTRRWVHVLNYRNEPAEATIKLPGCGGRKLNVLSPGEIQPVLTVLETGTACATFLLSGIQTWAVVEVI